MSEGRRIIRSTNGQAEASYEIGPLPDGRYAITMRCRHHDLALGSISTPWQPFPTREACLRDFVETASAFFSSQEPRVGEAQGKARAEVLELLSGGLFGFVEPAPCPEDRRPSFHPEENPTSPAPAGEPEHHG